MSNICGVYKITCNGSGRVYIGSSRNVNARITQHVTLLSKRKHHNDDMIDEWEKFGKESFEFGIIDECEKSELLHRELEWCIYYDSFNPKHGFNKNRSICYEKLEPPHLLMTKRIAIGFNGGERRVLMSLALKMNRKNVVFMTPRERKILASASSVSLNTFSNNLVYLAKKGAITRIGHGEYLVDDTRVKWGKYEFLTAEEVHIKATYTEYVEQRAA